MYKRERERDFSIIKYKFEYLENVKYNAETLC